MLWLRGSAFTLLVPFMVGVMVPRWIAGDGGHAAGWLARATGSIAVLVGTTFYLMSLLRFLAVGGTPSIYFLRSLRSWLGEEPSVVVERGPYGVTRNPMYVGVLIGVLGQALIYGSSSVALYGVLFGAWLHVVVTRIEEPHLRRARGPSYDDYCRRVPRWLWR